MSAERSGFPPSTTAAAFIGKETMEVRRLDAVFDQCVRGRGDRRAPVTAQEKGMLHFVEFEVF